jgi:hypothetical protein
VDACQPLPLGTFPTPLEAAPRLGKAFQIPFGGSSAVGARYAILSGLGDGVAGDTTPLRLRMDQVGAGYGALTEPVKAALALAARTGLPGLFGSADAMRWAESLPVGLRP